MKEKRAREWGSIKKEREKEDRGRKRERERKGPSAFVSLSPKRSLPYSRALFSFLWSCSHQRDNDDSASERSRGKNARMRQHGRGREGTKKKEEENKGEEERKKERKGNIEKRVPPRVHVARITGALLKCRTNRRSPQRHSERTRDVTRLHGRVHAKRFLWEYEISRPHRVTSIPHSIVHITAGE